MSTQPTDADIAQAKSAIRSYRIFAEADDIHGRAVGSALYRVANSELARCYLRLVAMQSARTPPPCAGDDVEEAAKLIHEFAAKAVREFKGEPQPWQNGNSTAEVEARSVARAIAALGTLPSIADTISMDELRDQLLDRLAKE
jgi:hypothetical protein